MHFCEKCDNMYYIRLADEDGNKLIYYCRNCGHEDSLITHENVCVNKTQIKHKEQSYSHIINNYTKLDPTLPRTLNIKCPNQTCPSNQKSDLAEQSKNEVIYLRYDDVNLNYVYICTQCDTVWKTNEQ